MFQSLSKPPNTPPKSDESDESNCLCNNLRSWFITCEQVYKIAQVERRNQSTDLYETQPYKRPRYEHGLIQHMTHVNLEHSQRAGCFFGRHLQHLLILSHQTFTHQGYCCVLSFGFESSSGAF